MRRWRAAIAAAVLVVATGFAAAYLLREEYPPEDRRRAGAALLMNELMSGKLPVGGPFTLADSYGSAVSLADFRGKLVLLYFGFLACPDICPTDMMAIAQAIRALGPDGDQLQPVFVTLDPERDGREALRAYVAAFHPRFIGLTGSEADVRRVATDFKVFFEKVPVPGTGTYTIDHAAFTFLLDREGRYAGLFPPGTAPARMAEILREQLRPVGAN